MLKSAEHEIFSAKNIKIPTIVGISYLLAEKCSCSAMFSKKEFAVLSNLRFLAEKISCSAELSMN